MSRGACPPRGSAPVAALRYRQSIERLERQVARLGGAEFQPLLDRVRAVRDAADALQAGAERRSVAYRERRLALIAAGRIR